MGCCGEGTPINILDVVLELYDLIQDPGKKSIFQLTILL